LRVASITSASTSSLKPVFLKLLKSLLILIQKLIPFAFIGWQIAYQQAPAQATQPLAVFWDTVVAQLAQSFDVNYWVIEYL
jgi:hypothetical protein